MGVFGSGRVIRRHGMDDKTSICVFFSPFDSGTPSGPTANRFICVWMDTPHRLDVDRTGPGRAAHPCKQVAQLSSIFNLAFIHGRSFGEGRGGASNE